jgi:hypothetical protein
MKKMTPQEATQAFGSRMESAAGDLVTAPFDAMQWMLEGGRDGHVIDRLIVVAKALASLKFAAQHLSDTYDQLMADAPPATTELVHKILKDAEENAAKVKALRRAQQES